MAEGARHGADEYLDPVVKRIEKGASDQFALSMDPAFREAMAPQQLPHFAVAPLLKVEAVKIAAEVA